MHMLNHHATLEGRGRANPIQYSHAGSFNRGSLPKEPPKGRSAAQFSAVLQPTIAHRSPHNGCRSDHRALPRLTTGCGRFFLWREVVR